MAGLAEIYRHSLALLTDLYQLTMAYGYWRHGIAEQQAVFCLSFRNLPFDGGYAVACGLQSVVELLSGFRYQEQDLEYLRTLCGTDGQRLFDEAFLEYLGQLRFSCDVDAIPEGTVVFPHEPLVRVRGPLLQAQVLETPLLNLVNFPTLIATKAARICRAAEGQPVLEFGLRRAHGIDGGVTASRAAFVGGCAATSNVLAGKLYGIPVKGTHAHSWVMAFADERAAFQAYADVLPANTVLLVDTFDTRTGIENAIQVAHRLSDRGYQMIGIRLDSGDMIELSRHARQRLDEAGLQAAKVVASGDLDEHEICRLRRAGARIDIWGVGTRLVTAYDQPALGGVYKLSALRLPDGSWDPRLKLSDESAKMSIPGIQQVRRFVGADDRLLADVVFDEQSGEPAEPVLIPVGQDRELRMPPHTRFEDLLVPVFRQGACVYDLPSVAETRERTTRQLDILSPEIVRLERPDGYSVGLDPRLHRRMAAIIEAHQGS